jgi:hypothetical protein
MAVLCSRRGDPKVVTQNSTAFAHRFFILALITLAGGLLATMVLPPQTAAALPPRPTPQSTQTPVHHADSYKHKDEIVGGQIELQVQPSSARLWTVVQWQDASGGWHDVEGWRGSLEGNAHQMWWVARSDFGKGPFRWVVCENPTGNLFAESQSFFLPRSANETVKVDLSLTP